MVSASPLPHADIEESDPPAEISAEEIIQQELQSDTDNDEEEDENNNQEGDGEGSFTITIQTL